MSGSAPREGGMGEFFDVMYIISFPNTPKNPINNPVEGITLGAEPFLYIH